MSPNSNSWVAAGRDAALLDMAAAEQFLRMNPVITDINGMSSDADLRPYKQATPEALTFLARQGYDSFVFLGLEWLPKKNAEALAEWDAFLCFNNLHHLDVECASILVSSGNQLAFESLREIGVRVARELARMNTMLCLNLENLSIKVANKLVRHSHELSFSLDTPPSDQVLHRLCDHAGYRLDVSWLRPLSSLPCEFLSSNPNKKVFVIPKFVEETGQWFENVYIGDSNFYPDSLVSHDGIIRLL